MFIKHLENEQYDTTMVCIDVFTKYVAVVPVKGKTENDLAFGMIESIVKMGHMPQVIYTDGETGIRNSGLFQKNFPRTNSQFTTAEDTQPSLSASSVPSNPCRIKASCQDNSGLFWYTL